MSFQVIAIEIEKKQIIIITKYLFRSKKVT